MTNTTETFKYLKLVNGDNIICKTTDDCKTLTGKKLLCVKDPVILHQLRLPKNDILVESYIMYPLFSFAEENVYEIPVSQIVVATNIRETLKKNYTEYLMQREQAESEEEEETETITLQDADDFDDKEYEDEMIKQILEGDSDENNSTGTGRNSRKTIH
jgi:hypothetical protein